LTQARLAARSLSVELEPYEARGPDEFEGAYAKMTRDRVDGLIVFPAGIFANARVRLVELAAKHRLPAMFEHRLFYVDKIFKGAKPADLPVEQPTRFSLVINLKTAKALGLTIPQSLLLRADEVIQ
jgi:putative ABC transport system substrate-binding protein